LKKGEVETGYGDKKVEMAKILMDLHYLELAKKNKLHFCVHFHFLMLQMSP